MRAMAYKEYGEPNTLQLMDLPTPKVSPGEVLIRAERASINPVDWKLMSGALDPMMDTFFPVIPGWDVYGVVEEVGPDVPEFSAGDRVASYARKDFVQGGTYAEYVSVPATSVAHVPETVSADTAAGLPLTGLTALRCLQTLSVTESDTVLIHAASGGVGRLASQLARELGARVIGTASEANHQRLRDWGVEPVAYGDGLVDRVRELAPEGVTTVVDCVGEVLEQTLAVLTEGGRHVSIADPSVLEQQGRWVWVRPDGARLESLLERVADGRLTVDIDTVYPLEKAAEAMQHNQRGASGKIVLDLTA
ncbi:NADP-dependent oxidoreductase [Nesterenkonia natronophila]|uniref:NADP-dependent oxidoreductase n=1 Tax=Nesterenkonia natronophila TaxID=2174932 RepID=A0A3A4G223_9MICC|nr:NADP-dependent oxidoreductase [Nesterenkonia natronophila]RJN32169.1 NADP-dependent oxidoreductase [Nesterenkonia natronophila]